MPNVAPDELEKFEQAAHRWWDVNSEFKPLHQINPLRLEWIDQQSKGLAGKTVLDVGCGGGILSESMAQKRANVTGIDLSEKVLSVARLHLLESGLQVDYHKISVVDLALEQPASFDIITCMEMLEHVPEPAKVVAACARLVKPGGHVFFATLNRTYKAWLFAIIGAEYFLRLLPRGTHDFSRFIKPSELLRHARHNQLVTAKLIGMKYHPVTQIYSLCRSIDVNYLLHLIKPGN